jgi:two-component system, cell cycle response regulator DivK
MIRIVLIEDNVNNARIALKLLNRAGFEVITAEDGETGLEKVMELVPDLVLVDLGLPDVDGQTVVGLMRQDESLKNTPIIAFTAWPEATAQEMASAYGCDGVITKPIDTRLFAEQVRAFLKPKPEQPSPELSTSEEPVSDQSPSK